MMLVVSLLAFSGSFGADEKTDLPELSFEKYELTNGLQVILHRDESLPNVAVNIWYHVGSRNERPGLRGLAHLFEHMMFKGSAHHDKDTLLTLQGIGAHANGMTDKDRTVYWELLPPDQLELALWLEADRMGFLLEAMTQEKLDNQLAVVQNELLQKANKPYARQDELLLKLLFPPEHPYSWVVGGVPSELILATRKDVADFFEKFYVPNNASLCVAGNFDLEQARGWIEEYFGGLPPGPPREKLTSWVPVLSSERRAMAEDAVELPRLIMSWHTPARFRPLDAEFDVLANILGGRKSSRLRQVLINDEGFAQDVRVRQRSRELGSTFEIEVTVAPGRNLAEVEGILDGELRRLMDDGVSDDEVKIAANMLEADLLRRLERIGGFGGRASLLNHYNVFLGDPGFLASDFRRFREVTAKSAHEVARDYLGFDQRAVLHIVPRGSLVAGDSAPDRSVQPTSSGQDPFFPPQIQTATLENGLRLFVVERHNLPLVEVHFNILSGWSADTPDKPGTCSMTAEMLTEGMLKRSAGQITTELDRMGARLKSSSNFDASLLRLNIPKGNLAKGIDLVGDLVMKADFRREEFQRIRQDYQGRLKMEAVRPRDRAVKELQTRIFGSGHPYAQPFTGSGTEDALARLGVEDLLEFHDLWYRPDNAAVVFVGDITLEEARSALQKTFGSWRGSASIVLPLPEILPTADCRIVVLDRPGSPQSLIVGGFTGLHRAHPDRRAFQLLNQAFGGNFSSRINRNLRSEKGYSYGAKSRLVSFREAGIFLVEASVQLEHTAESLAELWREMEEIGSTRLLGGEELENTRTAMIDGFPRQFETLERIATSLDRILACGMPLDDWQTARDLISSSDSAKMEKLAKSGLDVNKVVWIIVGDWEEMKQDLVGLNLGKVEVMEF